MSDMGSAKWTLVQISRSGDGTCDEKKRTYMHGCLATMAARNLILTGPLAGLKAPHLNSLF